MDFEASGWHTPSQEIVLGKLSHEQSSEHTAIQRRRLSIHKDKIGKWMLGDLDGSVRAAPSVVVRTW